VKPVVLSQKGSSVQSHLSTSTNLLCRHTFSMARFSITLLLRMMCRPSPQVGIKVVLPRVLLTRRPYSRGAPPHYDFICSGPRVCRKPMQSNWSHDDACMACGDGGELLLCDMCPAAYHLECIGAGQVGHTTQSHLLLITIASSFYLGAFWSLGVPPSFLLCL
jgi:hypothetical protein